MNFTHLAPKSAEPEQELLQKFRFYVVLFIMSPEDEGWVTQEIGPSLRADSNALCWVLTANDLNLTEEGSTLYSIVQKLRNRGHERANNSWLAWTTREGLFDTGAPGGFRSLNFDVWLAQKSKDKLLEALGDTMDEIELEVASNQCPNQLPAFLSGIGSSLVASLIFELLKLPEHGLQ